MARQFHRPARLDPEVAESIEGGADTAVASELAHRAAQALIGGFPTAPDDPITREGVIAVVAGRGIDDVAELWADSPAATLPGALWRLFLVREWIRRDPGLVERRYATVVDLTGPDDDGALASRLDAALAEGRPVISPQGLRERLDAALAGALEGSVPALAPLLATASAFLAALAAGSAPEWIDDDADPLADRVTRRDSALLATADELGDAAARARAGLLD
ncbi:hypothetical protein CHIBA101_0426 [Actinomyces sp. Chiba101]|uniref:DNA-directed RNA polymerase subunit beta n=1 Tax=Actinomyces denticolens TaxID=52767 RepID=A0ABY1IBJ5_9ACTO|nr:MULTISPECIES: hypothetical protein [Actinomyces]BAW92293.1 hypothetical protein CHIBA101_0426 [Actinomyces sp. Chiba101]GAV94768.1 hypothetical protein ADENT20671_1538 [Actinomyces denticolens]SHI94264.1 hypothetical protein SAMN05216246_107113 [Actinomyces denticolens]SUU10044.1 Uncharacterised protein [Actinomyces denticolens]